jgi:hypothetical protein
MAKRKGDERRRVEPTGKAGAKENKGMANSLIKGLALTLGGGLAVGLGIKIGQNATPPQEAIDFGPVLDRIEGVESRIVNVETAHATLAALSDQGPMVIPSVQDLEARVNAHTNEVEVLRAAIQRATEKSNARIDELGSAVHGLEAKLPTLIDSSIKPKFEELHERVQREMQETASQTLEVFADRIQARVVEKITSIEGDLTRQSEAINDLRDYSLKTDQNLQRLLAGVENLADKINRKFEAPTDPPRPIASQRPVASSHAEALLAPTAPEPPTHQQAPTPAPSPAKGPEASTRIELSGTPESQPLHDFSAPKPLSRIDLEDAISGPPRGGGLRKAAMGGGVLALTAMVFGGVELAGVLKRPTSAQAASNPPVTTSVVQTSDALDAKKLADQSKLLDQARGFTQKREYAKAEEIYRAILKSDPSNTEVKHLLASALFRQEKIDESVKVLNSISEENQPKSPQR